METSASFEARSAPLPYPTIEEGSEAIGDTKANCSMLR
jgi:hypothetical protein